MQENMSPAPWYTEEFSGFIVVFDDNYEVVCHIEYNDLLEKDRENAMANAKAIAATPKMLSLIRDLLKDITTPGTSPYALINWGTRIREIIAKVDEDGE